MEISCGGMRRNGAGGQGKMQREKGTFIPPSGPSWRSYKRVLNKRMTLRILIDGLKMDIYDYMSREIDIRFTINAWFSIHR